LINTFILELADALGCGFVKSLCEFSLEVDLLLSFA
jgi:hypothetical protein